MRKQQQVWKEEHKNSQAIPSLAEAEPSGMIVEFVELLKSKGITSGKVIDIGCGKGRNSVYLARQGFEVFAADYIKEALEKAKELATANKLENKIHFINSEIDKPWPFEDNFFDIAVDCFSSIDIETKDGREVYRKEMLRTLKSGGLVLVSVVSSEDVIEKEFLKSSPGKEKNSTIWPNGKFQKDYDEDELREFYKDFEILELKEVKKSAFKLAKKYTATNFYLVLRKAT